MRHIAVGLVWVFMMTAQAAEVQSPNGEVRFTVTAEGGQLQYRVDFDSKPVIEDSPIRFSVDGAEFGRGVQLGKPSLYEIKEKYAWRGVHSTAVGHCRGAKLQVIVHRPIDAVK